MMTLDPKNLLAICIVAFMLIALLIYWLLRREQQRRYRYARYGARYQTQENIMSLDDSDAEIIGPTRIIKVDTDIPNDDEIVNTEEKVNAVEPPPLMCVYIKAKPHEKFYGYELLQAILNHGFVYGAKQFFHYVNHGQTWFSLASLTAPGMFDLDNVGAINTSGLCIFMQPQRLSHPANVYDAMVTIGQHIAEELGGVLEDEHHHLMTAERFNDWRSKLSAQ